MIKKLDDLILRMLAVVIFSIVIQILIYMVFPQILGDSFESTWKEYFTHIFVFCITFIIIYGICIVLRKFRFSNIIISGCYFLLSIIFNSDLLDGYHTYTFLSYIIASSVLIYLIGVIIIKMRIILILPIIYFIHFIVFYMSSRWSLAISGIEGGGIHTFFIDGSRLLLCYSISLIPFSLIIYFFDRYKSTLPKK